MLHIKYAFYTYKCKNMKYLHIKCNENRII